jgi:hypothetical protein
MVKVTKMLRQTFGNFHHIEPLWQLPQGPLTSQNFMLFTQGVPDFYPVQSLFLSIFRCAATLDISSKVDTAVNKEWFTDIYLQRLAVTATFLATKPY